MKGFNVSATGIINSKAQEMKRQGILISNFSSGDPVLPNHPILLDKALEAISEKISPYAPIEGFFELRELAANWMNERYQSCYRPAQAAVTCGGKFAIYAALQALLEPQDEVLIIAPYWVSYPEMVRLAGGVPKILFAKEANQWKITPHEIMSHITPRTKALIFNNANNPTGALYHRDEICSLLDISEKITIISDEVYSQIVFDDHQFVSFACFPEKSDRYIIIESCSKNFAMAGYRVGFAFGSEEIIRKIVAFQSQTTTGTSYLSQKIAIAALRFSNEVSSYVREAMKKRRDIFFGGINENFGTNIPPVFSGLYFFAPIRGDSIDFCEKALTEARVALVPGVAFGMENFVRFAFSGTEEEITSGIKRLKRAPIAQNFLTSFT